METFARSFCSSNSTHYYPAAQQFSKTVYISACVFSVICSFSSTLGNTMIVLALRKCQSLHSPSKALLCSLALTDLFVGLIVLPLFTAYYLMIILEIPGYYCVIAIIYEVIVLRGTTMVDIHLCPCFCVKICNRTFFAYITSGHTLFFVR